MDNNWIKAIYYGVPNAHRAINHTGEHCVFYRNRFGIEVIARLERMDQRKLRRLYKKLRRKGLIDVGRAAGPPNPLSQD